MEWDGPLLRVLGWKIGGFVMYRDLGGVAGSELDELIARQVRFFAERDERFEWKLHGHDRPPDLAERLQAAGFVPEAREAVVIAVSEEIAGEPRLPEGVILREVTERADFNGIGAFENTVWQEPHDWLAESLEAEQTADPDELTVIVAEHDDTILCAGWVRFSKGTDFATLWGGATLPDWRGQGIYRAAVAYRAKLASRRGFRYIEVDASDDSRPILERLGFVKVTTTTPFIWSPRAPP